MSRTTIYTCCDSKYIDFIPIFLHSILCHNTNVDIEIGVNDLNLPLNIENSIEYIRIQYPESIIKIKLVTFNSIVLNKVTYTICPNVVRFIIPPEIKNDYVYISDVDIIMLEKNISEIHKNNMVENGLGYSNIVRPGSERLTGLHFTKWENYYPIPDFTDLAKKGFLLDDEIFLYHLVKKGNEINNNHTFRPVHGIHVSPNRRPFSTSSPDWGLVGRKDRWTEYRNTEEFLHIETLLSRKMKKHIEEIDSFYMGHKEVFKSVYLNNLWKNEESRSGPGSTISKNTKLLKIIEDFVTNYNIKTILDVGCGDFNWMRMFNFNLIEKYVGIDIVDDIITDNTKKYKTDKISFECHDSSLYDIPENDLIICKDITVHLPNVLVLKILENIKKSKSTYLLSTTFTGTENNDISIGEWRPINLEREPFNMIPPILFFPNIEERSDKWLNKGIGIWKINS